MHEPKHPKPPPAQVWTRHELKTGTPMRENIPPIILSENGILSDVKTLRDRARKNVEQGAVTHGYKADRETVLRLLDDALATEIVCVLRYKRHYYMATGIHAQSVAAEFLEHAAEEQSHADLLAERIVQLGGEPNLDPDQLSRRSHAQYAEGKDLADMIREDLVAERIAIDSYAAMIRYLGDDDSTTRRMLEGILAAEEEHAEDLISLLRGQGA
jgi:bacterioferritin